MEKLKKKMRVEEMFVHAVVVANRVAYNFNSAKHRSESDLIQPWHVYPTLFENEDEEIEKRETEAETARIKAAMDARVAMWNKKFEEEHSNGA